MSAQVLNRHQARWNMWLSRFDFIITYRPRKQQRLSDALSKRLYLSPKVGEAAFDQQYTTLLKPEQFKICTRVVAIDDDFLNQVRVATMKDSIALVADGNSWVKPRTKLKGYLSK